MYGRIVEFAYQIKEFFEGNLDLELGGLSLEDEMPTHYNEELLQVIVTSFDEWQSY